MSARAWRWRWRWWGVLLGILALAVHAQTPQQAVELPSSASRFQRLTVERGLTQSTITTLVQDRLGMLWVGTQNGLNRFDGYEVRNYLPDSSDPHAISDNFVTSLQAWGDGSVWVGTLEGLNRYEPLTGEFSVHLFDADDPRSLPGNAVHSLLATPEGQLWVGTEAGLALWLGDDRFQRVEEPLPFQGNVPDQRINALAADRQGQVWVGGARGVARYDIASGHYVAVADFPAQNVGVSTLMVDAADRLWVGTDGQGLLLLSADRRQWSRIADPARVDPLRLSSPSIRSVLQDHLGRIWIGTDLGLDVLAESDAGFSSVHFRHVRSYPDGLGDGGIASLFEDRDGGVWVGSWNSGVSYLSRRNNLLTTYTADVPVTSAFDNASGISLLGEGSALWVGTAQGMYRFDLAGDRLQRMFPGLDDYTYYSAQVVGDELWFGTTRGISRMPRAAPALLPLPLPAPIAGARGRRLLVDDDAVWVAVDPIGVAMLSRDMRQVLKLHSLRRAVTFVAAVDDYRVVGAYDGLYWFDRHDGDLRQVFRIREPGIDAGGVLLPSAPMAIARTPDGRRWIATNGNGLLEMRVPGGDLAAASFVPVEGAPGLRDGALKSLLVDRRGQLWMSASNGISRFDPASGQFRNFDRHQGTLPRDYINSSATTLADGRLAFGGMQGFTVFDPQRVDAEPIGTPPAPLITDVRLGARDGQVVRLDEGLLRSNAPLQASSNDLRNIEFAFASADFSQANALRYQYRLDGFDGEWRTVGAEQRSASYSNLAPDSYRFRVRAARPDGDWSAEGALDLRVLPLWWETAWAKLALLLAVALVLAGAHRLRMLAIARQSQYLARLVDERTHELRERSQALQEAKVQAERSLRQLESTQQELVRSEKMAALGQLVAGVAHEVNTPLGVALTAGTMLRDATRAVRGKLEQGALKKSELAGYFDTVGESASMIERNLERAAHLIANFKQVSVDRTSDGRRRFDLAGYLGEVLESLELMWKRRAIDIEVEVPPGILMDSFPGTLGQIITNLTQNAVLHAFTGRSDGRMRIGASLQEGGQVAIEFSDNGNGIAYDHIDRIFEPFFTTRRGEGGTGLGLHIVYNLVTQKLGGRIGVRSAPGQGTTFVIELPLKAPD